MLVGLRFRTMVLDIRPCTWRVGFAHGMRLDLRIQTAFAILDLTYSDQSCWFAIMAVNTYTEHNS